MKTALLISLIGAGMVFVGLILLWGMMVLLVRLTSHEKPAPESEEPVVEIATAGTIDQKDRQKAAAAAVAAALALSSSSLSAPVAYGKETLSPWQSIHRTRQINQSNALPRRENH